MVSLAASLSSSQTAVFRSILSSADKNTDSSVSKGEAEASRKFLPTSSKLAGSELVKGFTALDTNRDNSLSTAEMAVLLADQEAQGSQDPSSPVSEAPAPPASPLPQPDTGLAVRLEKLAQAAVDKNEDGVYSKDELEASRKRLAKPQQVSGSDLANLVAVADADKDRKLSLAEITIYLAALGRPSDSSVGEEDAAGGTAPGRDGAAGQPAPADQPSSPPAHGEVKIPENFPVTGPYKTDKLGAVTVWGMAGEPQSAEKPYSINYNAGILRIEAHQGDRRQKASEINRAIERSEVSFPANPFQFGQTYDISFDMMFEGGATSTAANDKFFQIHNVNDPGDASLGPIFAMQLEGDRMRIVTRSDAQAETTSRVKDNWIYEDDQDITRDKWYSFDIKLRVDPFGNGLVSVSRDGKELANYKGPVGYNDAKPPYAKVGVYRDSAPEDQTRLYKDLSFKQLRS